MTMPEDPAGAPLPPPKSPPADVTLRAAPRAVTRLNRRTLMLGASVLAAAVLGATLWSLQPRKPRGAGAAEELYNVERVAHADSLDQLPADYSKLVPAPSPELGPPLPGDLGAAMVPSSPVVARYAPPGHDPATAARDARRQEAESAAASPVFFNSGGGQRAGMPPAPAATAAVPASSLAGFDALASGQPSATLPGVPSTLAQNGQAQKADFLKGASTQTRNAGDLQPPASPYMVTAGMTIAAALVGGIQSDLPGELEATVTQPVYDKATGQHLLIPQGSTVLGRYNSQVSYGQRRLQVVWYRIILPDTSSVTLDNFVGTDVAGYAGLEDGVDWHWGRIFGGAVMTTLLGVGAELAAPENRQDGNRVILAGRDSAQDSINQVGQEMTRRNLDIQPTLTIRPGFPVSIAVNRDLVLRPYQPMFFQRGALP